MADRRDYATHPLPTGAPTDEPRTEAGRALEDEIDALITTIRAMNGVERPEDTSEVMPQFRRRIAAIEAEAEADWRAAYENLKAEQVAEARMLSPAPGIDPADMACPMCGHPVRVVGGSEGTMHYEPVEARASASLDVIPDHVVDREGLVWRIVRDGGMAVSGDYTGITSIGVEALRQQRGPLHAVARLSEQPGGER